MKLPRSSIEKIRSFFEESHGWHGSRAIVDSEFKPHMDEVTLICACGARVELDSFELIRRGLR